MKVSELHEVFLDELGALLPEWKYVKSLRTFKLKSGACNWLLHVTFINHASDFDATADVSIEFFENRKRLIIVGAELGNIEGTGQRRFAVTSNKDTLESARTMKHYLETVGLPFLHLYSDPRKVLSTLIKGGEEAQLISPLLNLHAHQIEILGHHIEARITRA